MYEIRHRILTEQPAAVMRDKLGVAEMPEWFGQTFGAVAAAIATAGRTMTGPPFARYRMLGEGQFEVEAGFPVDRPIAPVGQVQPSTLPGGPTAVTLHTGPYDGLTAAYEALATWLTEHDAAPAGTPWETYLTEPTADPATWQTEVFQPYAPRI